MNTNKITITIRVILGILIAVCWLGAFILFRKKPGDVLIFGFICTVILATLAELVNNYFVRRKK